GLVVDVRMGPGRAELQSAVWIEARIRHADQAGSGRTCREARSAAREHAKTTRKRSAHSDTDAPGRLRLNTEGHWPASIAECVESEGPTAVRADPVLGPVATTKAPRGEST